jgi:predicted deacylase
MQSINKTMIEYAIKIAHEVEADALLFCVDVTKDIAALPEEIKKAIGVIIVTTEVTGRDH